MHRFSITCLSLYVDMYIYMSVCVHAYFLTYTYIFLLWCLGLVVVFFYIYLVLHRKEALVARHTATISAFLGDCYRSLYFKVTVSIIIFSDF